LAPYGLPVRRQTIAQFIRLAAVGEGEPVVLLHGFPEHWWQWHAVAPLIAADGYRVLCPDLRGAGWTVADDSRIERETRLHDLLALFDVLDIERGGDHHWTAMYFDSR
jgi:pimeloyl-ACP methyl ester carboxylesterase